jgi:hypothetical protein
MVQTDEKLRDQGQGCMVDILQSQCTSIAAALFWHYWQQNRNRQCHTTTHLLSVVFSIYFESQAHHTASHCNVHWLSSHLFLIMLKNLSPWVSQQHEHNFSHFWLRFKLVPDRMLSVFIPYSDICSLTYDGSTFHHQWQFTSRRYHLLPDTSSKDSYRCQTAMAVLFYKLFGTHLAETVQKCSL